MNGKEDRKYEKIADERCKRRIQAFGNGEEGA
jgi:hypothetical protein